MQENSKVDLKIDWATHESAKYACKKWHYSKSLPGGKLVKIGAWEDGLYVGCVVFGRGANNNIGKEFGLNQTECIELVRIALTKHITPVSQICMNAIKMLSNSNKGLRLLVSYADPEEGHNGGIYQAMNWIYTGMSLPGEKVYYKQKWVHRRTVDGVFGNHKGFVTKKTCGKHKYLMPLDKKIKKQFLLLAKPYPKKKEFDKCQD